MTFIREHQLSIMLFMSGISAMLAFTILIPKSLSRRRKSILSLMAVSSMMLLIFERYAYLYRGVSGKLAYYIVRISNGFVFFLLIAILNFVTQYLKDLFRNEGKLRNIPLSLKLCDVFFWGGAALLIISQFTGLYYYFDEQNVYHRSAGFIISYIPSVMMVILQEYSVIRIRRRLNRIMFWSLLLSIGLPTVAAIAQIMSYGVSLVSMALVLVVVIYYILVLNDMNKAAEASRIREIEFYKEARRIEAAMFEQTAEALVNAIDAKDIYTHGHSTRVAMYSREIAQRSGMAEEECDKVYFAALLHDVGKIGIPDSIINKVGELTDEEYEKIKGHTTVGDQILRSIKQSPTLRIGAHYHHERYDGSGYPEGLAGEDIPKIARIVAVADAYDAMTSTRSYRDSLPMTQVKRELTEGIGKQFDPRFAQIMLKIIEDGE